MSLFERVRSRNATNPSDSPDVLAGGPLRLSSAISGASAALVSMLILVLPVLLAWVASPRSTVGWTQALSVGSCLWLLAHGASLSAGSATISLTPLLLACLPVLVATVAARQMLMQLGDGSPRRLPGWAGLRRDVAEAGLAFVSAYAAVGLAVALATAGEPLSASLWGAVAGTTFVGLVSVLIAVRVEFRGQLGSVAPGMAKVLQEKVSPHLRRAVRPGLWGACAVFGAGVALTVLMVVLHLGRVGRLYDTLGADPVGVVMITLGQLTVLPNVALWAASWMAGPGFGLGERTSITWSQSDPGLLPLIPGLGAVPVPGQLPAGLWLSALIPVAAGALVGWRALRAVARLSSWRVKATVAAGACVVAALLLTLGSALAGGSLGAARLSGLGAPSLLFGASVLAELLVGAVVTVGLSHLRAVRS